MCWGGLGYIHFSQWCYNPLTDVQTAHHGYILMLLVLHKHSMGSAWPLSCAPLSWEAQGMDGQAGGPLPSASSRPNWAVTLWESCLIWQVLSIPVGTYFLIVPSSQGGWTLPSFICLQPLGFLFWHRLVKPLVSCLFLSCCFDLKITHEIQANFPWITSGTENSYHRFSPSPKAWASGLERGWG
jgi:hypothetical protein